MLQCMSCSPSSLLSPLFCFEKVLFVLFFFSAMLKESIKVLLPLDYPGVPGEKQKDKAGFGIRRQLADSEGLYWKPTAETVAKTCPTALMAELSIYITSRKENAALYDFA